MNAPRMLRFLMKGILLNRKPCPWYSAKRETHSSAMNSSEAEGEKCVFAETEGAVGRRGVEHWVGHGDPTISGEGGESRRPYTSSQSRCSSENSVWLRSKSPPNA